MGLYLNPGNMPFARLVKSGRYVDKSGLLSYTNQYIDTEKHLIASSRPRRFGKTLAAQMLAAYYGRGCNSEELFQGLDIKKDASFKDHLNRYDVISLDIQAMYSIVKDANLNHASLTLLQYINSQVIGELSEQYPDQIKPSDTSIAAALAKINKATGNQFVIIIDEWDCLFREEKTNSALQEAYINFLRSLFKGNLSDHFVRLAYITGILPIKKYGTQSALNNFRELTMTTPGGIAKYIGFTEKEVRMLCKKYGMPFAEMQKWYDGYYLNRAGHIYSPNSVMEAIDNADFQNYWSRTETYEDLKIYIEMDFDGLRQKVLGMLGGSRCRVAVDSFQNDMTSLDCADDVLTLLIHLGYLAYDSSSQEAFIPNEEIRSTFVLAVRSDHWGAVYQAIQDSDRLLKATLAMDNNTVAQMVEEFHRKNSSSLLYNNEASLASVIQAAYYSAAKDYRLVRELPAGNGFADMAFIPKRKSSKPALLIELKWDKSPEGALNQIRDKKYASALEEYKDNLLLVGINYDKKTRKHQCQIERALSDAIRVTVQPRLNVYASGQ